MFTVLAIVIIVFLIAFFIVPIARRKTRTDDARDRPGTAASDAGQPYTPLFDEGISIVGDPAPEGRQRPGPGQLRHRARHHVPARAGTGGGDMPEFEPNNVILRQHGDRHSFLHAGHHDAAGDMDRIRVCVTAVGTFADKRPFADRAVHVPLNPFLDVRRQDGSLLAFQRQHLLA
ncbi:MAG: hypothetical protein IPF82_16470 [Blastocatellia bacterium]|nr:hypothetical protein [Blastocatellia bacterium]